MPEAPIEQAYFGCESIKTFIRLHWSSCVCLVLFASNGINWYFLDRQKDLPSQKLNRASRSHDIYMARKYIMWKKIKNAKSVLFFKNYSNNTAPLIFFPAEGLFKHNFTVISNSSNFFFLNIEFLLNFAFLSILYCLNPPSDTCIPFCARKKKIYLLRWKFL